MQDRDATPQNNKPSSSGASNPSQRAVVTLPPAVAAATRRIGEELGDVPLTEVVRRALLLLDVMVSLPDNEELVIRNKDTRECDRIRFAWQLLSDG